MPPSKTKDTYAERVEGTREVPKVVRQSPASKSTQEAYDPQGSGMDHDPFFASVAPGITDTGNLKHQWGESGAHWGLEEPPQDLKSE